MDSWMDGQRGLMNECMDGWMDGRMEGWMNE